MAKTKHDFDLSEYDFLDLGSKNGGSIQYCAKRYRKGRGPENNAKGIGIDINPEAVANARAAGFDSIEQDILDLDIDHKFSFVSALDFLEHLPSVDYAESIIKKMSELAEDFLFIRHPSFDDMAYLEQLGLKITWTDWSVHTAPLQTYDFANIFNKLGLKQYCFVYKKDLVDSSNDQVLPLDAPEDTKVYDDSLGKKPDVTFDRSVYSQIDIFVALRPIEPKLWEWITRSS